MGKFDLNVLKEMKEKNKQKKVSLDLKNFNMILYGMPDSGKTSLASALFEDNHVLLACEYGAKSALCANDIPVASYKDLQEITKTLATTEARDMFGGMCVIDTVTRLGELLQSYILSKYGKDFLDEVKSYNRGYQLIDKLYSDLFSPMKQVGWSFCYITHDLELEMEDEDGKEYVRHDLQTNKRLAQIIKKEADLVWFINKKGTKEGAIRTIVFDETQYNFGKNKVDKTKKMPLTLQLENDEKESASKILDVFKQAVNSFGEDRVTEERVNSSVEAFREEERDIKEVIEEMIEYGGRLSELGLRNQAVDIMNRALGTDFDGNQRNLDDAIQENVEALEIGLNKMKDLYEKNK